MVTIIRDKFPKRILKLKIMSYYFVLIAVCLVLINVLAYRSLENHYVGQRREEIYSYAKTLAEEASQEGVFGSEHLKEMVNDIAYESYSRINIIPRNQYITKGETPKRNISKQKMEDYGVSMALEGHEYVTKTTINKERLIIAAIPVVVNREVVGAIFISNSLGDIYANIGEIRKLLRIITLATLGVFIVTSYLLSGRITKPIEKVIDAIEAMAEGKLQQRVDAKGSDEIASLCHAFNDMNEKITEMDKERRQFVADASHELKSPLASIKVLVDSLASGAVEKKDIAYEFLDDIGNEVDRLTHIVGSLLELTKLEGRYAMKAEKIDVNKLLGEVITKLSPLANARNISVNYSGKILSFEGNRDNIFRAIYNIVENAIKYSDDNNSVDVWTENGSNVRIYIKDHGIGIPEEEQWKIFDRFYRVDKARNRKTGGSGLGLSIVKEIINRHRGKIEVQSRVGEGSLFIITIPCKLQN